MYTYGMPVTDAQQINGRSADQRLSLRQRTRAAMKDEVTAVAFELFAEHGYDSTTVDQIAKAAGMSRTTFFRYFGTKEELVLGRVSDLGHRIADALAARPAAEPPWLALRHAFDVVVEAEANDPSLGMGAVDLLSGACSVMTKGWDKSHGWQSILAPRLAHRLGGPGPAVDLRARVLVAAGIACLDAATDAWIASGGDVAMPTLLDEAMGVLREVPCPPTA